MDRIYGHDMTTTSGGNISLKDESGDVWITPARLDKGNLKRGDIVRFDPKGFFDGSQAPSSEYPFHLSVYAARPDIRAIIHAHATALVSFSICGQVPDTRIFPESYNLCGEVAFSPYALPGSALLGSNIAEQFASPSRPNCVVLENHGVVVGGRDLAEAFRRFETLEFAADTIIRARQLGDVCYLSRDQIDYARANTMDIPHTEPRLPTSRGKEARKEICDFVHRAYEHRLMTSGWGSFSTRIAEDAFVITPKNVDRRNLDITDLVIVRDGYCGLDQIPSRAVHLHRAIYQAHPEINAVVNALPVNGAAFSASKAPLDTRTIPESYLFLKDVPRIPFDHVYGNGRKVAAAISVKNPVALLENNGVLVAGRSVLDAFDRLEVLESTAKAIIQSRPLGPINPMPDQVIQELQEAFPSL